VVGQHAKEDVRLNTPLQVMENGPLAQRTFHGAKGRFDTGKQDVGAPDFLGVQVAAARLEQVAAIKGLGFLLTRLIFAPRQEACGRLVVDLVVARYAAVTLF
jgi:hypothetical protein